MKKKDDKKERNELLENISMECLDFIANKAMENRLLISEFVTLALSITCSSISRIANCLESSEEQCKEEFIKLINLAFDERRNSNPNYN